MRRAIILIGILLLLAGCAPVEVQYSEARTQFRSHLTDGQREDYTARYVATGCTSDPDCVNEEYLIIVQSGITIQGPEDAWTAARLRTRLLQEETGLDGETDTLTMTTLSSGKDCFSGALASGADFTACFTDENAFVYYEETQGSATRDWRVPVSFSDQEAAELGQ